MLRRCLPTALLGGKGRPFEACERDFRAVARCTAVFCNSVPIRITAMSVIAVRIEAMLSADDGESEKAHIVSCP